MLLLNCFDFGRLQGGYGKMTAQREKKSVPAILFVILLAEREENWLHEWYSNTNAIVKTQSTE